MNWHQPAIVLAPTCASVVSDHQLGLFIEWAVIDGSITQEQCHRLLLPE